MRLMKNGLYVLKKSRRCKNKIKFSTALAAELYALVIHGTDTMQSYLCLDCKSWHNGHKKQIIF